MKNLFLCAHWKFLFLGAFLAHGMGFPHKIDQILYKVHNVQKK